jgi:hypothetical protein
MTLSPGSRIRQERADVRSIAAQQLLLSAHAALLHCASSALSTSRARPRGDGTRCPYVAYLTPGGLPQVFQHVDEVGQDRDRDAAGGAWARMTSIWCRSPSTSAIQGRAWPGSRRSAWPKTALIVSARLAVTCTVYQRPSASGPAGGVWAVSAPAGRVEPGASRAAPARIYSSCCLPILNRTKRAR